MTATPSHYSPTTPFLLNKSEFEDRFGYTTPNTTAMSKLSLHTHSTASTMSDRKPIEHTDTSPTASFSSGNSSYSSMSSRSLAKAIARANANPTGSKPAGYDEQASVETPLNKKPYVVEEQKKKQRPKQKQKQRAGKLEAYVQKGSDRELAQWKPQNEKQRSSQKNKSSSQHRRAKSHRRSSKRIPRVTAASAPFEKTIPPTSFLREELSKDPAYRHALKAGTLWQSLIGQHVKLPALWFDGEEPARPYLGCEDRLKRNKWSYFGRHRVAGDPKLNSLVKDSRSSGKLLLHIICRNSETFEPTEDIVVGAFHPNAEGIRDDKFAPDQQRHKDYRDVWIGHRSRSVPHLGRRVATRIESLLRYLNKNKVDKSPLSDKSNANGAPPSKHSVDNTNMNSVFGSRPPKNTVFVQEETLHSLLMLKLNNNAPSPPPSVLLLRNFLREYA